MVSDRGKTRPRPATASPHEPLVSQDGEMNASTDLRRPTLFWHAPYPLESVFRWSERRAWYQAACEAARDWLGRHGFEWPAVRVLPALPAGMGQGFIGLFRKPANAATHRGSIFIRADQHEASDVLMTLLHELAHALAPQCGHGPGFRSVMKRLGYERSGLLCDRPGPLLSAWITSTAAALGSMPRAPGPAWRFMNLRIPQYLLRAIRWCADCGAHESYAYHRGPSLTDRARMRRRVAQCVCSNGKSTILDALVPPTVASPELAGSMRPDLLPMAEHESATRWASTRPTDSRAVRLWCGWLLRAPAHRWSDSTLVGAFSTPEAAEQACMPHRKSGTRLLVASLPAAQVRTECDHSIFLADLNRVAPYRHIRADSEEDDAGDDTRWLDRARRKSLFLAALTLQPGRPSPEPWGGSALVETRIHTVRRGRSVWLSESAPLRAWEEWQGFFMSLPGSSGETETGQSRLRAD